MANNQDLQRKIDTMQKNLYQLRRIAGWTAEELGDKLGVTKQTIRNIETRKVKLSQMQYIAIRTVFEFEKKSNTVLANVITVLLDEENEEETKEEKINKAVKIIATTSSSKEMSEEQVLTLTDALLDSLGKDSIKQTTQIINEVNKMTDELFDLTGETFGSLGWLNPFMSRRRKR